MLALRYKKLLGTVDLTKDFYFSYSYHVMKSLQRNLCDNETGQVLYETMFVWNEFLTRRIRNILQNTTWTVALVYGFFKQVRLLSRLTYLIIYLYFEATVLVQFFANKIISDLSNCYACWVTTIFPFGWYLLTLTMMNPGYIFYIGERSQTDFNCQAITTLRWYQVRTPYHMHIKCL